MSNIKLRREGKYWYICGSSGRRSFHYSTGKTDKGEAKLVLNNFVLEKLTPKKAGPAEIAIDLVLRRYADDKRDEMQATDTAGWAFDNLTKYYGVDKPVSYIDATTNKEFELHFRGLGLATSSINRMRTPLRAAMKHAVKDGKLLYAPHIPILKVPKGKEVWLTRPQDEQGESHAVLRLYRAIRPKRYRYLNLFARVALGTGARHRAILALTWDRIDFKTGIIDFRDLNRAETNKRRPHAPVNDDLLRLLRAARRVSNSDYVIAHRGGPIKTIYGSFISACKRAKLPGVTPHTTKHTYITWLLRDGATFWEVAGLTNTTAATIEKVYGHHSKDNRMRDVANLVRRRSARIVPESLPDK